MSNELAADVLQQDGPEQVNAEESESAKAQSAGDSEPQADANEGDDEHEEPKKRLGGWQRKIQKLERELDYWRETALDRPAKPETTKPADEKAPKRPSMADFKTLDEYDSAMDEYHEKRTDYKIKEALKSARAESDQRSEEQKMDDTWQSRVREAKKDYPDFEEVAYASDVPITDAMNLAIKRLENGPAVAYYLGQHVEEAERISNMIPLDQAVAIGRIEARIAGEKTKAQDEPAPKPRAPKPPTPIKKPTPTAAKDIYDESMPVDEWMRLRNKQVAERGGR